MSTDDEHAEGGDYLTNWKTRFEMATARAVSLQRRVEAQSGGLTSLGEELDATRAALAATKDALRIALDETVRLQALLESGPRARRHIGDGDMG